MSRASRKLKFHLQFSGVILLLALLLNWLIVGDSSPFHDYFLWHTAMPNIWGMTSIVPYILSAIIAGNPHSPSMIVFYALLSVQWLLLGLLLSIPVARLMRHRFLN